FWIFSTSRMLSLALPVRGTLLKFAHRSMLNCPVATSDELPLAFMYWNGPEKLIAWPTLPAAKVAPFTIWPLLGPALSLASFSPFHHARRFRGGCAHVSSFVIVSVVGFGVPIVAPPVALLSARLTVSLFSYF